MLHTSLLQLSIFSFGAMSFACALFAFALALSVLRHQRLAKLHYAVYDFSPMQQFIKVTPLALFSESVPVTTRYLEPLSNGWHLPTRETSADELNIIIQPDVAFPEPAPRILDPRSDPIEHPKVS